MIEVEKKFLLTNEEKERLIEGAEFLVEKKQSDVYYDTADYKLTLKDWWLRSRNGIFELKVPLTSENHRSVDQYEEYDDEDQIRELINLPKNKSFQNDLVAAGYEEICNYVTIRRKYRKGEFVIDVDVAQLGNETFLISEIELLVEDKDQMPQAIEKILSFAKTKNLKIAPVRGKAIEYLKRFRPDHFQALLKAGVIVE